MRSALRLSLEKESFAEGIAMSLPCPAGDFNKLLDLKTGFFCCFFQTFNVFLGIRIFCYHETLFEEKKMQINCCLDYNNAIKYLCG